MTEIYYINDTNPLHLMGNKINAVNILHYRKTKLRCKKSKEMVNFERELTQMLKSILKGKYLC